MPGDEDFDRGYDPQTASCIRSSRERLLVSGHRLDRTRLLVRYSSEKLRTSMARIEATDRLVEGLRCLLCAYGGGESASSSRPGL